MWELTVVYSIDGAGIHATVTALWEASTLSECASLLTEVANSFANVASAACVLKG